MNLLKVNYLEDCTVFEVINFSYFMFGFLSALLGGMLLRVCLRVCAQFEQPLGTNFRPPEVVARVSYPLVFINIDSLQKPPAPMFPLTSQC